MTGASITTAAVRPPGRAARWIALGALLGFLAVGSNVALMAVSAYLISKAALVTNVAEIALVDHRGPGPRHRPRGVPLPRAVRDPSRDVPDPGRPAGLVLRLDRAARPGPARRGPASGDLLARIVADIETLEDFYVRVVVPPVVAGLVTLFAGLLLGAFDRSSARRAARVPAS